MPRLHLFLFQSVHLHRQPASPLSCIAHPIQSICRRDFSSKEKGQCLLQVTQGTGDCAALMPEHLMWLWWLSLPQTMLAGCSQAWTLQRQWQLCGILLQTMMAWVTSSQVEAPSALSLRILLCFPFPWQ